MSEPTRPGLNISSGDKGVDRSQTTVDNSSRVTNSSDDHSVRTKTVTDNSSSVVTIHANDNRGRGVLLLAVIALIVVAVVVVALVRELAPRGAAAPVSPAPVTQLPAPVPGEAGRRVAGAETTAVEPMPPPVASVDAPARSRSPSPTPSPNPKVAAPTPKPNPDDRPQTASAGLDRIDIEETGWPMASLPPASREAYESALRAACVLAERDFLRLTKGEPLTGRTVLDAGRVIEDVITTNLRGIAPSCGWPVLADSFEQFASSGKVTASFRFRVSP